MIRVLRPQSQRLLRRAIDRAVATDATLAPARPLLMQPLDLLEAFAIEAEGALGEDALACERLRLLLSMSAAHALELQDALRGRDTSTASLSASTHVASTGPCDPGVIDLGALVIVGLAAGRVGRRVGMAGAFVDTVLGIALWAAPAEALARALAGGLADRQLAAMLAGFAVGPGSATRLSTVVPMFLDSCERARWRCLDALFDVVREQSKATQWDAAWVSPIETVEARAKGPTARLVARLRKGHAGGQTVGEPEVESADLVLGLKDGRTQVVFATASSPTMIASVVSSNRAELTVTVDVPAEARAGWLGLSNESLRAQAQKDRRAVHERWSAENDRSPCLRDTPVPLGAIATQVSETPTPARSAVATWGLRITDVVLTQDGSEALTEGRDAEIVATYAPASVPAEAELRLGELEFPMESSPGALTATIAGRHIAAGAPVVVRLFRRGDAHAEDEHSSTIDATAPTDSSAPAQPDGDDLGDDAALARGRAVAFVRPALLLRDRGFDRVALRVARALVKALDLDEHILPWLGDEDLALEGSADDPDGPAVHVLFERLTRIAARTTGLEHAVLIALVPTGHEAPLWLVREADHASKLVIANAAGVRRFLGKEPVLDALATTSRLRVVGRIRADDVVLFDQPRVERRAAGPGATFPTDFSLVGLDRDGREVQSWRIRTVHASRAGVFSALVPTNDTIVAAAIRYEPELLAIEVHARPTVVAVDLDSLPRTITRAGTVSAVGRFGSVGRRPVGALPVLQRPPGRPTLKMDELTTQELSWHYSHDRGIRGRVDLELGARTGRKETIVWMRVSEHDAASARTSIPLRQVGPGLVADQVRAVASDGWNTAAFDAALPEEQRGPQLLIRRASRLRYWSDLADAPRTVEWSIRGNPIALEVGANGAVVEIPPGLGGKTLVARIAGDDATVTAELVLPSE